MTRRTWALLVILVALIGGTLVSALPVRASHAGDVAPASIDPNSLALPLAALPAGARVDHSGVSNNDDANGTTTPADGFGSKLRIIHQTAYDQLGRITGYRMDFVFMLQGQPAGTEYLASIYPNAAMAAAAVTDAIGPGSLITIIGQPLAHQCSVADECHAYSGPVPGATPPLNAVLAIDRRGPIVVETATQVLSSAFDTLEPALETSLYGLLQQADVQVQVALKGGPPPATDTPTPMISATNTPTLTPTNTPTSVPAPTDTPTVAPKSTTKKKCPKYAKKRGSKCICKKGYTMKHGKCVKKKHS